MTTWTEVLNAVIAGPQPSICGTMRDVRWSEQQQGWVPRRDGCRIWSEGPRRRVESSRGVPIFITDGAQSWDFSLGPGRPVTGSPERVRYRGHSEFDLGARTAADWADGDFSTPMGPLAQDTFAGRECWTVLLAPPTRASYPLRVWIDIVTGQILGTRTAELGEGTELTDLVIGAELDATLFTWTGPTMTPEQRREMLRNHRGDREQERLAWFAAEITTSPLPTRVPLDFTPTRVFPDKSDVGAFDAMNDRTALARRPRGANGWEPRWGDAAHYVWSTPCWDWAARANDLDLDEESVRLLQDALHPGEPVDRQRRIGGSGGAGTGGR